VSLGLGTVPVGAFRDDAVKRVLGLPEDEEPLYLIPVGRV
jgi:nitroreductase